MKVGLLLCNVGSPDAPTTRAVHRYLKQFLSDPRVMDLPAWRRWWLLNAIILPFRSPRSARAYQKIWTEGGSPLLVHTQELKEKLGETLPDIFIEIGMRYGHPSIAAGLKRLKERGVGHIILFPLYPQYSVAATGSTLQEAFRTLSNQWNLPAVSVIPPFFREPGFIQAYAIVAREALKNAPFDHFLFSFHGLPERHLVKSEVSPGHCLQLPKCCETMNEKNTFCYRAQCVATAQAIATTLGLSDDQYSVSFQSRLGKYPWIQPYTDQLIPQLIQAGKKRLVIMRPSFVSDCLETLEEMGMREKERARQSGGGSYQLIPCLNSHPAWIQTIGQWVRNHISLLSNFQ